jgi:hypothetical protein
MDYIGKYDNLPVYEANGQAIPKNTSNLYVTAQGTIYFGGVAIGKLDRRTLKVLSYDKDIYYKEMSRQKESQKQNRCCHTDPLHKHPPFYHSQFSSSRYIDL